MSVTIRIPRPFLQTTKSQNVVNDVRTMPTGPFCQRSVPSSTSDSVARPFSAALAECAKAQRIDALKNQRVLRTRPARAERQTVQSRPITTSPLLRAFGWLRSKCAHVTEKQLRVAETVSLGEKRFVAIIHADGRKFLVGGGTQGVALLTTLGESTTAAGVHPSLVEFAEHSA